MYMSSPIFRFCATRMAQTLRRLNDVDGVNSENASPKIREVELQRLLNSPECQLIPRYFRLSKEFCFHRFVTGIELRIQESRAVEKMHLAYSGYIHNRKKSLHLKTSTSFFIGFAGGSFRRRFT